MLIDDLDAFRDAQRTRTPLWAVRWLPYVESPPHLRKRLRGTCEDIYTTEQEAKAKYAELCTPGTVEIASLHRIVYGSGGSHGWPCLDDWKDPTPATED